MINIIKNYIKTKPMIYDFINNRRTVNNKVDIWMNSFSISNNKDVTFIQVGANDGLRWDHMRRFVVRDKWKGVFVEPILPVYNILRNNYQYLQRNDLFFENCLVSQKEGVVDFYTYSDEFLKKLTVENKMFFYRKSSMDRNAVEKHLSNLDDIDSKIVSHQIASKKLQQIIEQYFDNRDVDIIFIDAEGHDDDVIYSIDFDKNLPKAIIYESHNLGIRNEPLQLFLLQLGYVISRLDGDSVAVRS